MMLLLSALPLPVQVWNTKKQKHKALETYQECCSCKGPLSIGFYIVIRPDPDVIYFETSNLWKFACN